MSNEVKNTATIAESEATRLKNEVLKPLAKKYKSEKINPKLNFRIDYVQKQMSGKVAIETEGSLLLNELTVKELVQKLPFTLESLRLKKVKKATLVNIIAVDNNSVVSDELVTFELSQLLKLQPIMFTHYFVKAIFRQFDSEVDLTNEPLFQSYFMTLGNESTLPNVDAVIQYEKRRVELILCKSKYNEAEQRVTMLESERLISEVTVKTETLLNSIKGLLES